MPTIYLAGPPNVGKSTVFNLLTGLRQHVGNWPGKTIEKREGSFEITRDQYTVIDLPGAYSLTCISPEEEITRDALAFGNADLIVVIANAAQLEKGLTFLAEVLLLGKNTLFVVNMMDLCGQEGISIDLKKLEAVTGIKTIGLVAHEAENIKNLKYRIGGMLLEKYQATLSPVSVAIQEVLMQLPQKWDEPVRRFIAAKLIEGDAQLLQNVQAEMTTEKRESLTKALIKNDAQGLRIRTERHAWADEICARIGYTRNQTISTLTEKLDRFTAHPWWGLLFFAAIIFLLFSAVFTIGTPLQENLDEAIITPLAKHIHDRWPGNFIADMVSNGLVAGVGLVLSFVPVLFLFFSGMALLEDVGYMTRAAFVMDRFMHRLGLHGRSFVPIFMGMGCNVPALFGTRVIDDPAARTLTQLLIPMVPCSARLAVIAFFGAAFFSEHNALFSWSMIFLPFIAIVIIGTILSSTVFKGKQLPLVMELPLYHLPNFKSILLQASHRTWAFMRQAGGMILVFSLLIFLLSWHPSGNVENSILGKSAFILNPVGSLFGADWRMVVALISSFVVKENTISTLSILTHMESEEATMTAVRALLTPQAAIAFMVIQMLFIPCVSTLVAYRKEAGNWKWPLTGVAIQTVISLVCGIALYQLAIHL